MSAISIVPTAMGLAARMVTLNHPAALDCQVWRKVVKRTDLTDAAAGDLVGGLPLLGGLPVLASDDEADVDYEPLGGVGDDFNAKCFLIGTYAGTPMLDNQQGADTPALQEARIEPLAAPGGSGRFEVQKDDLVMVFPGLGVVFTFIVQEVMNTLYMPPYVPKYVLSAQGDLTYIPGVAARR